MGSSIRSGVIGGAIGGISGWAGGPLAGRLAGGVGSQVGRVAISGALDGAAGGFASGMVAGYEEGGFSGALVGGLQGALYGAGVGAVTAGALHVGVPLAIKAGQGIGWGIRNSPRPLGYEWAIGVQQSNSVVLGANRLLRKIPKDVLQTPQSLLRNSQGRILAKDYTAYVGMKDGKQIYAGITRQPLAERLTQHGDKLDMLIPIAQKLTRRQARAIEQVMIEDNPQFINQINSIGSYRPWYNDAVSWGRQRMKGL